MLRSKRTLSISAALVALALTLLLALPLGAQDAAPTPTPDPNFLVVISGIVDLSHGDIRVDGYVIAPDLAILPENLGHGDIVIVIGYLSPDRISVRATTFELLIENLTPTPEPTAEVTIEVTLEVTPEVTLEPTFVPTPTATVAQVTCNFPGHPVASRIAEAFAVSYDEVIGWHCQGFGFGEITRAYLLEEQTGVDVEIYMDMRDDGRGWGQIVRESGVHPSDLAPGQIHSGRRGRNAQPAPTEAPVVSEQPVQELQAAGDGDNNNGRGNGNNGRGNGRGNGNNGNGNNGNGNNGNGNNGRGNGNNGNNGNGRGNGRGNG